MTAWAGLSSRDHLLAARGAMEQGRSALLDGDVNRALAAFNEADRRFAAVEHRLGHAVVRPLELLPAIGANLRAVRMLAIAGGHMADAGDEVAAAALDLPEGAATLAPKDGAIPVESLRRVAPALAAADANASKAVSVAQGSPKRFLVPDVAYAREEFVDLAEQTRGLLSAAAVITDALPPFLGADGQRRYFFGAQNPAELRGTGGFIGAYAILTVDEGRLRFDSFKSVVDITNTVLPDVPAPTPEYEARYAPFGGAGFPQNINMTPDFPSAASAILNLYETAKGERLDGVIAADPFAMQALVEVTGSVEVPGVGEVAARDIPGVLAVDGYGFVEDPNDRKGLFGAVAAEVLGRFLDEAGTTDAARGARALAESAGDGHVLLYSEDSDVQAGFAELGIAGAFSPLNGDFLSVVFNNAGANKVDYFVERAVTYETWLQPDGSARSQATVAIANDAPMEDWPPDVIGPNVDYVEAGEAYSFVSLYAGADAVFDEPTPTGTLENVNVTRDLGRAVIDGWQALPSGDDAEWSYTMTTPAVWTTVDQEGEYRLDWHNQPTSLPTALQVRVHLPPGAELIEASDGVQPSADGLVWAGPGDELVSLRVRFRP